MKFELKARNSRLVYGVFEGDKISYVDGVAHVYQEGKIVALVPLNKDEYIKAVTEPSQENRAPGRFFEDSCPCRNHAISQ